MRLFNKIRDLHFTNTCIVGSVYSLFIYLLIKNEEEINRTFFFLGEGIKKEIRDNLKNKVLIDGRIEKWNLFFHICWKLKLIVLRKSSWRFIEHTDLFGHDHLVFSPVLIRNLPITVIEDGLVNYRADYDAVPSVNSIKRMFIRLFGRMTVEPKYGKSKFVDKLILTGLKPILSELKEKSIIIDINKLWSNSSKNKRELLLNIFNIDFHELEIIKNKKILLLTQPLNGIISEEELLDVYRKSLDGYNKDEILIKAHPRDTIDYKSAFKDYHVLQSPIPMELLSILGLNFSTAITITSTAIFSLPENTKKIILGHECHPEILRKLGPSTFIKL